MREMSHTEYPRWCAWGTRGALNVNALTALHNGRPLLSLLMNTFYDFVDPEEPMTRSRSLAIVTCFVGGLPFMHSVYRTRVNGNTELCLGVFFTMQSIDVASSYPSFRRRNARSNVSSPALSA